jgi:hypothetical protein
LKDAKIAILAVFLLEILIKKGCFISILIKQPKKSSNYLHLLYIPPQTGAQTVGTLCCQSS